MTCSRTFWSDSVTVVHWIKTYLRAFNQFVANRVSENPESFRPKSGWMNRAQRQYIVFCLCHVKGELHQVYLTARREYKNLSPAGKKLAGQSLSKNQW